MNNDSSGSSLSAPSIEIIETSARQLRNKRAKSRAPLDQLTGEAPKSLHRAVFTDRNQATPALTEHLQSPVRIMMKSQDSNGSEPKHSGHTDFSPPSSPTVQNTARIQRESLGSILRLVRRKNYRQNRQNRDEIELQRVRAHSETREVESNAQSRHMQVVQPILEIHESDEPQTSAFVDSQQGKIEGENDQDPISHESNQVNSLTSVRLDGPIMPLSLVQSEEYPLKRQYSRHSFSSEVFKERVEMSIQLAVIDPIGNELTRAKYSDLAEDQTHNLNNDFAKEYPEIVTILRLDQNNVGFAQLWSKVMLLVFGYNYFTCFWMIGFKTFPHGVWFGLEACAEVATLADFFIACVLPRWFPKCWKALHQTPMKESKHMVKQIVSGVASLPFSIILASAFSFEMERLSAFWIACTRLFKLYHYRGFKNYFETSQVNGKQSGSVFNILATICNFLMLLHALTILFLLPGRFAKQISGWEASLGYNEYTVPNWQKYLDSSQYCVSNMTGMGFGNIVPLTNFEYFMACIILTSGVIAFLQFYSDILFWIEKENRHFMENQEKLDQFNYLADVRYISPEVKNKVTSYFKQFRIHFEEIKGRKDIIQGLPTSLQSEIAQVINNDVIRASKLFQEAGQDFINKVCRYLKPEFIFMNQHVVFRNALAYRMYFICEGVVEVLASDEKKLIRFLSKGAYFGEIGVLIKPHQRSCSVVARTSTLLYYVKAENMQKILDEFPEQLTQLKNVATQRLKTTHPIDVFSNEKDLINQTLKKLESCSTVFGNPSVKSDSKLLLLRQEFEDNMTVQNRISLLKRNKTRAFREEGSQLSPQKVRRLQKSNSHVINVTSLFESTQAHQETSIRRKLWQSSDLASDLPFFIIEVFSPVWIAWNLVMLAVVAYDQFMILFSLAFDFELTGKFIALDVVCICLLATDIFVRAKTAITSPKNICFEKDQILDYYVNTWLLLDVVALFPFCYLLMIQPNIDPRLVALARLPRLLKIFRFREVFQIFEQNTEVSIQIYRLVWLCLVFWMSGNLLACAFGALGRHEYRLNRRFNGMCLFKQIEKQRKLESIESWTKWELYVHLLYLGCGLTGSCIFGDVVPFSPTEQILGHFAQIWGRAFLLYINSQFASYIGSQYSTRALHVARQERVLNWMKQNSVSSEVMQSYKDYEENMWDEFEGNDEEVILKGLPRMLRYEVRSEILAVNISNWEPLKNESAGVIFTIIHCLKTAVYPQQNFVFYSGELASNMYFIISGTIKIMDASNEVVERLGPGKTFGETALKDETPCLWKKHAYCESIVCLAVLTKSKFDKVAKSFPYLRKNIRALINQKKEDLRRSRTHQNNTSATGLIDRKRSHHDVAQLPDDSQSKNELSQLPQPQISKVEPQNTNEEQDLAGHLKLSEMSGAQIQSQSVGDFFATNLVIKDDEQDIDGLFYKVKNKHKRVLQFFVVYNLIFIPLQFAFHFKFTPFYLVMELLTILVYLAEIFIRVYKFRKLKKLGITPIEMIKNAKDRHLRSDKRELRRETRQQLLKLIVTSIAVLPFSLVLSYTNSYKPFPFLAIVRSLRLIKWRPFIRIWSWLQSYSLHNVTLIKSVVYYYAVAHWCACYSIGLVIDAPDHRLTWLRNVPAPRTSIRETASVFDDLSFAQLYNSALYEQVNIFSNLCIGDILAFTPQEKILVCVSIFIGTFVYNFSFANITTVVMLMSQGSHIDFFKNYNKVLEKIDNGKVQKKTLESASNYFYYVWDRHQGVSFEELADFLPQSMSSNLCISLYSKAIEQSLLFCRSNGQIDIPLVSSTFARVKFRTFRSNDLVVKIGQPTKKTYILIEGELRIYGHNKDELLGVMTPGSHFGVDLSDDAQELSLLAAKAESLKTFLKLDPQDNLGARSIVNVFASQFVTVAIIKKAQRGELYKTFPEFKRRMRLMNRVLFQLGLLSLEHHARLNDLEMSKQSFEKIQIENISTSTKERYSQIIDESMKMPTDIVDLTIFIKQCSVDQLFGPEVVQHPSFQDRLLASKMQKQTIIQAGDSKSKAKRKCPSFCNVKRDSRQVKVVKFLHLLNILYIAFMIPFSIAFQLKRGPGMITCEVVSLCISAMYVIMRFRFQINVQGSDSQTCRAVIKRYYNEGLIIDLFGLLPVNLILCILFTGSPMQLKQRVIVSVFRMMRVLSIFRGLSLIEEFTVQLTSASSFILLIKAAAIWFIIGHFISCAWFYLQTIIQHNKEMTWLNQQQLGDKTIAERYLRVFYFTCNIGYGIGTGDMIPQNELERLGIIGTMTSGDVFFVFSFGLIIYFFALQMSNPREEIEKKISQIHQLGDDQTQVEKGKRIQTYFAFLQYQKQNLFLIDKKELKQNLPVTIVQDIEIQTNEQILNVIFKNIKSENLIKELCLSLNPQTYLPGDFVMRIGDSVEFVFFIADGTLFLLATNKSTIVKTLTKGEYFGEIDVVQGNSKRSVYVQAATFCTLNKIKKEQIFKLSAVYPQLMEQLKATARQKTELIKTSESQSEGRNAIEPKRRRQIELFMVDEDNEKVSLLPAIGERP